MRRILLAAPITLDLLEFEREAFIDDILKRTRLMFGEIDPTLNRYGIVDSLDPRTALSSETSRPLVVSVNATDPATVDISPGTAVFQSGEVIVLSEGATRVAVPGGVGTKSVVFLRFSELEQGPRLTNFGTLANTYVDFLASDSDYVQVLTRNAYDALSFDEKSLTIPLAHITVQEVVATGGGTTTELVIDLTQDQLATNRLWFTPVDVEHRSLVGSGVVSARNPHGVSLNDLSASSSATLFQLHLDHGMIVSKDRDLAKVPGKICEETILAGAIQVDTTGNFTGIRDAYFFETVKFPTQILRCTDTSRTLDLAPVHIPRKNVVFLLPTDQYVPGTDLIVYYMSTDAAEPPTGIPLTSLVFKQPSERETIVSGGYVLDSLVNLELTFEDASPIPQRFIVYVDGDGFFQRYPQTCECYTRLTDIGFTLQTFDQALRGPARLKVGLQGAVLGATLNVQIQITGRDSLGAIVSETITFDSTWVENIVGTCSEESQQFRYTTNEFTSITNYIVTNNVASGPDASIAIFGDVRPETTESLADILPVAEVIWDGLQVCSLEDIRPINTTMHLPRTSPHASGGLAIAEGTLIYRPGFLFNFWVDDFNTPKFISSQWSDTSTSPSLSLSSTSMRKVFDGLDRFDTYVGRPIPVRPHDSAPIAIRFTPIEPDRDFHLHARS